MGETTKIEWADSTFNPWIGCERIGPGCDHCYAEAFARRTGDDHLWQGQRRRTSMRNWEKPRLWAETAAEAGERRRVFCASLADVFDNQVEPAWRADLFELIYETRALDWLILTKRIGNAWKMINETRLTLASRAANNAGGVWGGHVWPWDNVWLGATVVNQEEAERDIPKLLATPARRRFLSIEPMLGPIDLTRIRAQIAAHSFETTSCLEASDGFGMSAPRNRIDWVIVGGESGAGARPMELRWVRGIRDQCAAAGVPFLFKQWGAWVPGNQIEPEVLSRFLLSHRGNVHIGVDGNSWQVGKAVSGRQLDGRTHDEVPT